MIGRRHLLRWRCESGDLWRMPRDCSHGWRRMAAILCGGIACLIGLSCSRLRRSRIRSRSSAVIGRSGRQRRGELSAGNRGSARGRRRWQRDMTGPRRVSRWRRRSDDPERLIIVEPIVRRDDTHDPDSEYACRRNPKREASATRRRCGLDVCIRATCTRMRMRGLPEHSNTLRIVSPDPSIHYVHVPSPCGVLTEMSRGTARSPLVPPRQCERCTRFSMVSLCAMKTLAIFVADPDGWPELPSAVLFRDDSTVGDDPMQVQHSLCLIGRTPMEL